MPWEPKDSIAIYAAVLATSQLFYNAWRHHKEDRDKAKKSASLDFKLDRRRFGGVYINQTFTENDFYYRLTIFNVGNSDIVIKNLYINNEYIEDDKIPACLAPAKKVEISLDIITKYRSPYYENYYYNQSYTGTFIEYEGEDIRISLMEKVNKVPHVPKKGEYYSPNIPNGQLVLKVENGGYVPCKHSWSDSASLKLEEQLNSIMIDLAKVTVYFKREKVREKQKQLDEERERQRAELLKQKQLEEQKRIELLEAVVSQWAKARQIREFVSAIEELPFESEKKKKLLTLAKEYADKIDPLTLL